MFGITLHNFKNDLSYHKVSYTAITVLALGLIAFGVTQYCNIYDLNMGSIIQYTCMGVGSGLILFTLAVAIVNAGQKDLSKKNVVRNREQLEDIKRSLIDSQYFYYFLQEENTFGYLTSKLGIIEEHYAEGNTYPIAEHTVVPDAIVRKAINVVEVSECPQLTDEQMTSLVQELRDDECFHYSMKGKKYWATRFVITKICYYQQKKPDNCHEINMAYLKLRIENRIATERRKNPLLD